MQPNRTMEVPVPFDELVSAVRRMKKARREAFVEDFLAATSPEYLESIREAREDYKAGRVKEHGDIFKPSKKSRAKP